MFLFPITGASDSSIELLPSPGPGKEWTSPLHSDEGHEGDLIFQFEGDNSGIRIPDEVMSHNLTNTFTISSWMKHKSHSADKVVTNQSLILQFSFRKLFLLPNN